MSRSRRIDAQIPVPYEVWERHQNGYLLEVEGNCMSKVYPEGCHILVDPTKPPMNGSIAVVKLNNDDYVMRRMYKGANTLVLSLNHGMKGIPISSLLRAMKRRLNWLALLFGISQRKRWSREEV